MSLGRKMVLQSHLVHIVLGTNYTVKLAHSWSFFVSRLIGYPFRILDVLVDLVIVSTVI
jgi:hypothetical protein